MAQKKAEKQRAKAAGKYQLVPAPRITQYGSVISLHLETDQTFETVSIHQNDTTVMEYGHWQLNADTIILNYEHTFYPGLRKINCYVKEGEPAECFEYDELVLVNEKLFHLSTAGTRKIKGRANYIKYN